jgi:enoyl-[acyl-carrier protein] reductase II
VPGLQLLREVRQAAGEGVVVLAAGGIADGLTAARALRHGADGVWVGTRLVASEESFAHPGYKQRLVAGGADDSRFTTLFGPEWPGQRQRVLRNRVVREWAGREERLPTPPPGPATIGLTAMFPVVVGAPYPMPKFSALVPHRETQGDLEEMDMPASGASMARIQDILPARVIVEQMMEGARHLLQHPAELDDEA